jgi:hypothetical protein
VRLSNSRTAARTSPNACPSRCRRRRRIVSIFRLLWTCVGCGCGRLV